MSSRLRQFLRRGMLGDLQYWQRQKALYPASITYWPFYEPSGAVAANVMGDTGNICPNPGYEYAGAGGADVWANWTETAGTGAVADETTLVHGGGHAAKLTAGSSANTWAGATLVVKPGQTYQFTFWTRGDGTNAGRYLIYDLTNAAIITNHTTTGIAGTAYAQFTGSFTAPAGCVSVSFRLECPNVNGGIAYFDDVVVTGPVAAGPYDATYTNCTLGIAGIGDGRTAVYFDGSTSYVNLLRAAFVNAFNPSEFGLKLHYKADVGVGTDGASRVLLRIQADASNYILIYKVNTPNNTIYCQYVAGGTSKAVTLTLTESAWVEIKMSVSKSADELKAYVNNVQAGATVTGLGTWTTTVPITSAVAGASTTAPALCWKGGIAHLLVDSPFDYPAGRLRIPIDAADVDSTGIIYAGRGSTIYKSTDGGDTWITKYTVPGGVGIIGRVFVDSRDYVYASGRSGTSAYGLYRSIDGGDNWTLVLSTSEGTIWDIDEDGSGNICCGLHGFGAATVVSIWKSTDGGATWVQKVSTDYGSAMQNHVHDVRYDTRTGYWYATLGDQISEKLLRSTDGGENWTVVSTGGTQLLAMAILGNYVYVGTDTGSGNKVVRFTDDGSPTVTLEDVLALPTAEDVAIFGAGENGSKLWMLGYKEAKTKDCKLYVYDGSTWTTPYDQSSADANRGFYTVSRHARSGIYVVSNDYGSVADYGIKLAP